LTEANDGRPPRTSDLLDDLKSAGDGDRITLGEIVAASGGRAHGLVLLILSLPETVPMIGLSAILAAPIFVLGAAMVVRGDEPPIPGWVRRRSLRRDRVEGAVRKTRRAVRWLDHVSKPRLPRLANSGRLQGAICVLMAAVLAIPIPGINILAAFSVAGTGLGILQRDGLFIAAAAVLAALALLGMTAVLTGAWTVLT
jgi:hypothetical protein